MFLIPGWQPVHWGQFFVEHLVCFSSLGYAGLFGHDRRWKVLCGLTLASLLKLTGHVLSGVVFFSQNAGMAGGPGGTAWATTSPRTCPCASCPLSSC